MSVTKEWVGSRQLLRRLRDAMARGGTARQRLDDIARIIARGMVADVCSVYFMRPGETLVLCSTEGLRKDAVFRTRLKVGQGLVGTIADRAAPLALSEAQSHPQFVYRPETGEEIYHSFLGVPVLRGGRVIGVLTVQDRTQHEYNDEEIETLETVAMVVAELIAGADLAVPDEPSAAGSREPVRLTGDRINGGLAHGVALIHERGAPITRTVAEDPEAELRRVTEAMNDMQIAIDSMVARVAGALDDGQKDEPLDILRTFRMIADDRGWVRRIREAIEGGLTAEAAVAKVQNDMRSRMSRVADPYIRERLHDLDDLAYRLLQHLTNAEDASASRAPIPESAVLIARSMGPAELLDYDHKKIRALLLDEASAVSHVAIVARALDIPAVGNVQGLIGKIEPGDPVLVDGDNGIAYVRPGEDVRRSFAQSLAFQAKQRAAFAAERDLPAVTLDGERIALHINAGLQVDLDHLHESGAEGVGLYRTEIPFMIRSQFPRLGAQTTLYQEIYAKAGDKAVVFRTLDIGGDKLLPYFRDTEDENPAMGWRALRMTLDRPAILRLQIRALIRASGGRGLRVMFPLVSEVAEFEAARRLLDDELARARSRGDTLPSRVEAGAMLEVPSLYFQLPQLLERVDFLSVGSNDLVQFLFACDRGNPKVSDRYDVLSPPVLRFLREVVARGAEAGVPVGLCGEMAGEPLEAMALIGLGFRSLSMPPRSIGAVRHMLRTLDTTALSAAMESVYLSPAHSVREFLRDFAVSTEVALGDVIEELTNAG